jgi:hypothetical protein
MYYSGLPAILNIDLLRWPHDTLYPLKLALTSSSSGGRSVGIVRWRTKPRIVFYYHVFGVPWLIILGSGLDDWIY